MGKLSTHRLWKGLGKLRFVLTGYGKVWVKLRLYSKATEEFWKTKYCTQRLWKSLGKLSIVLKGYGKVLENKFLSVLLAWQPVIVDPLKPLITSNPL